MSESNAQCWQSLSVGSDNTIAIKADGKIWGWGNNGLGALGLGKFSGSQITPTPSNDTSTFTQIASGGNSFSIALKSDGTLWATGSNTYGFLGIGNYENEKSFTQIGSATDWKSISAGGSHVLAIKTDGTLWAWGANNEGQLGNGTKTMSNVPIQIGVETNWQHVSAGGYYFSAAIKTDGTLWVWGNDSYGQLGNGQITIHYTIPTKIDTATDWQKISAGQYQMIAIKNNGTLWAWGDNSAGSIGIGNTTPVSVPIQVGIANNWKQISAGNLTSYAIKTDGTLWAWGYNSNGQLGDGTTTQKTIPTQIGLETNWQLVAGAMSYYYAVALKNDGSAWSWGINNFGVLGDGTTIQRTTPIPISCTTLGIDEFIKSEVSIFPNPSNGIFNLNADQNIKKIILYDILGKEVELKKQSNNQFLIANKGLFVLKIEFENGTVLNKKIVIK